MSEPKFRPQGSHHLPSGTGSTSPVQLRTVAIVAPQTMYGVPNVLQFCGSQECCAECGAWFCGICLPQQLTPMQSIDVQHPAKKQGAELCGCQHGVVLNDSCPEWNPSLHGTILPIVPLWDMAKQHHHMLLAVLENRFVHYNLVQLQFLSRRSSFVNMLLGRLNWASTFQDDAQWNSIKHNHHHSLYHFNWTSAIRYRRQ